VGVPNRRAEETERVSGRLSDHGPLRRKSASKRTSLRRRCALGCRWIHESDGNVVTELAKGSRQHPGALLLSLGIRFVTSLDESDPVMQDVPKHAAESMCNGPDGGLIAQPR